MKMIISALALALSFSAAVSAQAADRKIGNVIAVERSIDNVYQDCADQFEKASTDSNLFTCKFDAKKSNGDVAPASQRLLTLSTSACTVEGTLQNSTIFVMVTAKSTGASISAAKSCLQQAINTAPNKDSFKFVMYTVE